MAKQSLILLTATTGQLNVTGAAFKAAGYFGYSRGIHTVCWYLQDFIGRIYVEGSLATTPTDSDWFEINLAGLTPYAQFPLDPMNPTGQYGGDSGIELYTFQCNLVWVRARVDRTYLINPNVNDVGSIQKVLLNY